jgi:hypothetical protein
MWAQKNSIFLGPTTSNGPSNGFARIKIIQSIEQTVPSPANISRKEIFARDVIKNVGDHIAFIVTENLWQI